MRSAATGFGVVFVIGLIAVIAVGLSEKTSLVYSLGVNPAATAATLQPGDRVCQSPVRAPSGVTFDRVGFQLGVPVPPGPPIGVEVRSVTNGRRLASGRLEAGYPATGEHVVHVGRVRTDEPLRLCLINGGNVPVGVVGQAGVASPYTSATLNGKSLDRDVAFNLRSKDRALLAALPDIADSAARFRAEAVTPLVYSLLGIAILVGAPLLLGRGLAAAARHDETAALAEPEPNVSSSPENPR